MRDIVARLRRDAGQGADFFLWGQGDALGVAVDRRAPERQVT